MPIDPLHGRNIPAGRRMARILQHALNQIKRQALESIRIGQSPDVPHFTLVELAGALVPEYGRHFLNGAQDSVRQIRASGNAPPTINLDRAFTLFLPTVKPAAQEMSTQFVRDFNTTTQNYIREAVAEGLEKGEPLSRIQARLMRVESTGTISDRVAECPAFSKKRAATIAATESSRAMHEGQMRYGQSVGASGLKWIASSDACDVCLSVNEKKVPYGTPFYTWPKAPPEYRFVMHPPMHPHCRCTAVDYFEDPEPLIPDAFDIPRTNLFSEQRGTVPSAGGLLAGSVGS